MPYKFPVSVHRRRDLRSRRRRRLRRRSRRGLAQAARPRLLGGRAVRRPREHHALAPLHVLAADEVAPTPDASKAKTFSKSFAEQCKMLHQRESEALFVLITVRV